MSEVLAHLQDIVAGAPAALAAAQPALERWGLLFVTLMVFMEFVAGLGYFSQANTTLLAAGIVYGRSPLLVLACVTTATIAATTGSYVSRRLGRLGSSSAARRADNELVRAVIAAVRHRAGLLAFIFHFSAWLRPVVPVVAGACDVRESHWLPWDIAGAATWVSIVFFIGAYVRGMLYRSLSAKDMVVLLVLALLFGSAAAIARHMIVDREARSGDD